MFGMGSGLTGYEGYLLGRRSVESAQSTARLVENLRSRFRPPPVDVNALMANNQALAAQNQVLRNQVADLVNKHNALLRDYQELSSWADGAAIRLKELGVIRDGK